MILINKPEIYIPIHFKIHELLPPEIYNLYNSERFWRLFSSELLYTIDKIKEYLESHYNKKISVIINDYFWKGNYSQSGLRTPTSKYYLPTSDHTVGMAADLKFKGCELNDVYDMILSDQNCESFKYITCVEDIEVTPTWLHISTRQWNKSENGILIVR